MIVTEYRWTETVERLSIKVLDGEELWLFLRGKIMQYSNNKLADNDWRVTNTLLDTIKVRGSMAWNEDSNIFLTIDSKDADSIPSNLWSSNIFLLESILDEEEVWTNVIRIVGVDIDCQIPKGDFANLPVSELIKELKATFDYGNASLFLSPWNLKRRISLNFSENLVQYIWGFERRKITLFASRAQFGDREMEIDNDDEWIAYGTGAAGEGSDVMHAFDWGLYNAKTLDEVRERCKDFLFSKRRIVEDYEIPPILALVDNCTYFGHGLDEDHFEEAAQILIDAGFDIHSRVRYVRNNYRQELRLDGANLATFARCDGSYDWEPFKDFLEKKDVKPDFDLISKYNSDQRL
jgi:hypothetical protein